MTSSSNRPDSPSRGASKKDAVEPLETRARQPKPKKMAELNLTSMLDVIFQLLIFFVLTASFAQGEGILPADLPSGQSTSTSEEKPPEQPIDIVLRSLGGSDVSIQLGNNPTPPADFEELFKMLRSIQNSPQNPNGAYNPDDPVIIKPDKTVRWADVVNAFNAAIRAKYTNVNFAQPTL